MEALSDQDHNMHYLNALYIVVRTLKKKPNSSHDELVL